MKYAYIPQNPIGLPFPFLGAETPDQAWDNLAERLAPWFGEKRTKEQLVAKGFSVFCWSPKAKPLKE